MDQVKIGTFLKELRKEKNLSQEQLAEKFFVSTRTISRWENGNTLPDISVIIELADFYEVDIRELLNGERKSDEMNTLELVADYTNAEKEKIIKSLKTYIAASVLFFALIGIIIAFNLTRVHGAFQGMAAFLATVGLIYSIMSVIKLRQLTGKMNKEQHKKASIKFGIFLAILGILALVAVIAVL